eukprot:Phypoly_transcript_03622.p1 GENE.Phypoly_transcript_03622~~Phypoly_transcript_03622.p1  ORF type:complete len:584 (+),score=103.39 Phypoly_transcript_03622:66-1817(+)
MLPLYSTSTSIKTNPRIHRWTKKWDKYFRTMRHQATLSTLILILLFASLITFTFCHYLFIFLARTAPTQGSVAAQDAQLDSQGPPKMEVPGNINIVSQTEEKDTKQIEIEPVDERVGEGGRDAETDARRERVKAAFVHAYGGYTRHAFGADELRPTTNRTNYSWGGFGITLFDALDTMLIMGLDDMYRESRDFALKVDFEKDHGASVFEYTIRYIGGLLGAYEITRERLLLEKAKELADRLMPAFNTPSGIPYSIVNLKTGVGHNPNWNGKSSILSEVGSIQLEFKYLSHYLGDPVYGDKADNVYRVLGQTNKNDKREGLYPVYINAENGQFSSDLVSLGGLGDSYYEYLLKRYVLGGKTEKEFRELYDESMESVLANLVVESYSTQENRTFTFLGEWRGSLISEMDHLVCYVPGTLALGAEGATRDLHMETAKQLAHTCYHTYKSMPTNIGPERVSFRPLNKNKKDTNPLALGFTVASGKYLLRPETIESLFYLWRYTGDKIYRDWGWAIFEGLEKYCKTPSSYSGLQDVQSKTPQQNDSMPSYFFAETLKYLYLLFSDNDVLPLDRYVFTTEAHALGILTQ